MNTLKFIHDQGTGHARKIFFGSLILWLVNVIPCIAQTGKEGTLERTQQDTAAVMEPAKIEKTPMKMSFEAFIINDSVKLVARVRSKVGSKFQNTPGVIVNFYKDGTNHDILIGKGVSNRNGEAIWMLHTSDIPDSIATSIYWAAVKDHPDYEDVEETVSVPRSVMKMELAQEDTIRWIKILIGLPDASGQVLPMPDVECKIYIKRLFGLLQVGDAQATDEEGRTSFEFPQDIQGDEMGRISIVAKISDHEVLGNVEANNTVSWGIPVKVDDFYLQRELWAARANSPILLIISVNVMLFGIWGVICFIFLEIFRINKLGRAH